MTGRHGRSAPLFSDTDPDVYLPDTSACINISEERSDTESVWRLIRDLTEEGRIVVPAQVLGELRDNAMYAMRLKPYERAFQAGDRRADDPEYLMYVGRITREHPGMCKATGWKTRADQYVIALAELERYVVVAHESTVKRSNTKIPGVCKQRRIRCRSVDEFVAEATPTLRIANETDLRNARRI